LGKFKSVPAAGEALASALGTLAGLDLVFFLVGDFLLFSGEALAANLETLTAVFLLFLVGESLSFLDIESSSFAKFKSVPAAAEAFAPDLGTFIAVLLFFLVGEFLLFSRFLLAGLFFIFLGLVLVAVFFSLDLSSFTHVSSSFAGFSSTYVN
jgi:hypothetical protein